MKWPTKKLADVAVIERESILAEHISTGSLYVGLEHITGDGTFVGVKPVSNGELASSKFAFTSEHLLYGKLRPYLRKIARPYFSGVCSTDILPIRASGMLDIGYLFHLLRTQEMVDLATARATGANLPRLSPKMLAAFEIPLPPLAEQKRIAAILDQADALRDQRRQALAKLDELLQAVFLDMFGDPGANGKKWCLKPLGQLIASGRYSLKRGPFGGALKKEIFVPEGYLVYEQFHAINNDFSMVRYFVTPEKFAELDAFSVRPGDLIVSCSGVTLGRIAEVPPNALAGIINQALLKITLDNAVIDNTYFQYTFRHKATQAKLFGVSRGSGVPNFPPMATIKSLLFAVPPIALQREFARITRQGECLKAKGEAGLQGLDTLFASLQQRAFKGDLWP